MTSGGDTMATTDYGFIGVGRMGSLMSARLLAAGHTVHVYDSASAAVSAAVANGARAADSALAVA
ncbi:MAG: NAD(P)-binding domain-containing protein, partial [Gammaproteobacteria bacterium]